MARLPRYLAPNYPQHIIQRGINRQPIFLNEADYQVFRNALVDAAHKHGLLIHAYVWMPNHIHLLATPQSDGSTSKVFQSLGGKYAQYFNATYQRTGTLWDGRYRATIIESERYLLKLMHYIEANPVRAKLTEHPEDYGWSSYRFNAMGAQGPNDDWLSPHEQYTALGISSAQRQRAYMAMFENDISQEELALIRENSHKGWALGGEQFRSDIEFIARRRCVSKGLGRPKKL